MNNAHRDTPKKNKILNIEILELRDFRCFEHLDIDFHPSLTVLVASNGAGKTSILDAIAIAFGPFIGAFDESKGTHFAPSDIRLARVRETLSNEMEYAPKGVRIRASGQIRGGVTDHLDRLSKIEFDSTSTQEPTHEPTYNNTPTEWQRSLSSPTKGKSTIKDAKELVDYGKRLQILVRTPDEIVELPLIAYYGTGRLWQQKKLMHTPLPRTSRTIGYADCLDPASSYKSFAAWFRYWNECRLNLKLEAQEQGKTYTDTEFDEYIQSVSGAINTCLAISEWNNISYSYRQKTLVANHQTQGQLPIDNLSDGIRNMIGMVADIAFRATKLNPHLGANAAKQTQGIVLIDEIDMHLHPEWQQIVLQNLTTAFPALQFIVTTHSPQVLSCVDSSCIRILKETEVEGKKAIKAVTPDNYQTKGVASSDILAQIMGVNPIPEIEEAKWVDAYHGLIQQYLHESDEGTALRAKLLNHFSSEHPVMLECDRMIRLQAFKQRLPVPNREASGA